ncbi:MAG: carboxy terminal-processing peptidase [Bacteriovoracaceae bacterium]|nr:carboxy terminal-processing peptidase [Bacteriovoracaceae bacterium]
MKFLLFLALITVTPSLLAQNLFSSEREERQNLGTVTGKDPGYTREMVLGNILKGALENMHLANKTIDDSLSKEAFKLYLDRIDYGKQFLTQKDLKTLNKYSDKMDDELVSGRLDLITETSKIMDKRIPEVQAWIAEILAKPMDYNKKENIETDAEKRKFLKDEKELKVLWSKILKYDVMGRLADLKEERDQDPAKKAEELKKSKKKKKKSQADGEDLKKLDDVALEAKARQKTGESYKKILERLKDEKHNDKLDKFYNSIARVYDPHTSYLIPEEKEDFDIDMSGKLEGIGAILREEGSYIKVEKIVPGSASWKTKELDSEDTILKVAQGKEEPVDVVDMPLREAVKLIRGKKGSEVRLTVKKPNGLIKTVPIIRDVVEIDESYVKGSVLELDKAKTKVGYINVPKFYRDFNDRQGRNCTDDVRKELVRLKKENIQGLILDLRNNGGGALEDARMISGLFFEKGPVVQVKASTGTVEILADQDPSVEFDKPMIVLINRFSASASEIVAAALQDYGRALVVGGEFSHGKGTVQLVVDLDNYVAPMAKAYSPLGALKITIQKFFRVNGSSTQYKGVTPDIILPDPYSHLESGEQFLKHSIPWAKVQAVPFKTWKKAYNEKKVVTASKKRVKENPRFERIRESIAWYDLRRKQTVKDLTMEAYLKDRKEVKERSEAFEKEEEDKDLVVKSLDPVKDKVAQEKFDEYAKTLRVDPVIEESMLILKDML